MNHKHITPNEIQQHESVFSLTIARQCTVALIVLLLGSILLLTQAAMASESASLKLTAGGNVNHMQTEFGRDNIVLARMVTVRSDSGQRMTALEIPKGMGDTDGYWLFTVTCLLLSTACYAMSRLVREAPEIDT